MLFASQVTNLRVHEKTSVIAMIPIYREKEAILLMTTYQYEISYLSVDRLLPCSSSL